MKHTRSYQKFTIFLLTVMIFFFSLLLGEEHKEQKKKKKKSKIYQQQPKIIEEIVVTGKLPSLQPLSTVSQISEIKLQSMTPKHLGEILLFTSGTYVSEGQKNESQLQIRGLSSSRLTLLYDGIPIYEPYFNSFDLKSLATAEIQTIKVIKGANSVLYGANTLGGVINILSKRSISPFLTLNGEFSENSSYYLTGSGGYNFEKLDLFTSVVWDQSDGFDWRGNNQRTKREVSDYQRLNIVGKVHYYPTENSEIMAQILFHTADYGIPTATDYFKSRYWRFSDWQRLQVSLGSNFIILGNGNLKTRVYYVHHYNVLDAYKSIDFDNLSWESTYNNRSVGTFIIGEKPLSKSNQLRFSLNAKSDRVRTQDDVGEEWEEVHHDTYSIGIEDEIRLDKFWKVIGGVSVDYLKKQNGENTTRANPILGVLFIPKEYLSMHLSLSQKSRFPSMKSLYSTSSGNTDLRDEIGRSLELGLQYDRSLKFKAAAFYNSINNMIQSFRREDGYSSYINVGEAEIYGFEMELGKRLGLFDLNLNYTFINATDKETNEKLDYVPRSQANIYIKAGGFKGFYLILWGILTSKSQAHLNDTEILEIPGYTLLNIRLEKEFANFSIFLKVENLLDQDYFTEPGFPMKARRLSIGFSGKLGGKQ